MYLRGSIALDMVIINGGAGSYDEALLRMIPHALSIQDPEIRVSNVVHND
jgi:hypothetical protein